MRRKLTGLFLLLSFLFLKSTALYAHTSTQIRSSIYHTDVDTDAQEAADSDQETKQVEEVTDQNDVPATMLSAASFLLNAKKRVFVFPYIPVIYLSLTNPPPDQF